MPIFRLWMAITCWLPLVNLVLSNSLCTLLYDLMQSQQHWKLINKSGNVNIVVAIFDYNGVTEVMHVSNLNHNCFPMNVNCIFLKHAWHIENLISIISFINVCVNFYIIMFLHFLFLGRREHCKNLCSKHYIYISYSIF